MNRDIFHPYLDAWPLGAGGLYFELLPYWKCEQMCTYIRMRHRLLCLLWLLNILGLRLLLTNIHIGKP